MKKDKLNTFVCAFAKLVTDMGFDTAYTLDVDENGNEGDLCHFDFGTDEKEKLLLIIKTSKCPCCRGDDHD